MENALKHPKNPRTQPPSQTLYWYPRLRRRCDHASLSSVRTLEAGDLKAKHDKTRRSKVEATSGDFRWCPERGSIVLKWRNWDPPWLPCSHLVWRRVCAPASPTAIVGGGVECKEWFLLLKRRRKKVGEWRWRLWFAPAGVGGRWCRCVFRHLNPLRGLSVLFLCSVWKSPQKGRVLSLSSLGTAHEGKFSFSSFLMDDGIIDKSETIVQKWICIFDFSWLVNGCCWVSFCTKSPYLAGSVLCWDNYFVNLWPYSLDEAFAGLLLSGDFPSQLWWHTMQVIDRIWLGFLLWLSIEINVKSKTMMVQLNPPLSAPLKGCFNGKLNAPLKGCFNGKINAPLKGCLFGEYENLLEKLFGLIDGCKIFCLKLWSPIVIVSLFLVDKGVETAAVGLHFYVFYCYVGSITGFKPILLKFTCYCNGCCIYKRFIAKTWIVYIAFEFSTLNATNWWKRERVGTCIGKNYCPCFTETFFHQTCLVGEIVSWFCWDDFVGLIRLVQLKGYTKFHDMVSFCIPLTKLSYLYYFCNNHGFQSIGVVVLITLLSPCVDFQLTLDIAIELCFMVKCVVWLIFSDYFLAILKHLFCCDCNNGLPTFTLKKKISMIGNTNREKVKGLVGERKWCKQLWRKDKGVVLLQDFFYAANLITYKLFCILRRNSHCTHYFYWIIIICCGIINFLCADNLVDLQGTFKWENSFDTLSLESYNRNYIYWINWIKLNCGLVSYCRKRCWVSKLQTRRLDCFVSQLDVVIEFGKGNLA